MNPQRCRVCGCTDYDACIEPDGFPCCWVGNDLCSNCAFFAQGDRVELLEADDFSGKEAPAPASPQDIQHLSFIEPERRTNRPTGAT